MKENKIKDFIQKPAAILPCPSCKTQFSRDAQSCPKCGKERTKEDVEKADKENANVKAGCFGCLGIILIFFLISIIGGIVGSFGSSSPKVELAGLTELESEVAKLATKMLGEEILGIDTIMQVAGEDEGSYLLKIEYLASDNLTKGMIHDGIVYEAKDFIAKISNNPKFDEIRIYMLLPHLPMTDQYGNSSVSQVAKIMLRQETARKVNWKNLLAEQFEKLSEREGDLWWHPALQ